MLLTRKFFKNYLYNFNNNYLMRQRMIAEIVLREISRIDWYCKIFEIYNIVMQIQRHSKNNCSVSFGQHKFIKVSIKFKLL